MMKAAEIQARYGAQVDMAMIKAEVDRQRAELQAMFRTAQGPLPPQLPVQAPAPMVMPGGMPPEGM